MLKSNTDQSPRKYSSQLDTVQALRAVAATLVLSYHLLRELISYTGKIDPVVAMIYPRVAGGVHIFFVLSGFLLIYSTRKSFGTPKAVYTFLYKRLVRIAPLYWTFTTLYIAVALIASSSVRHSNLNWLHIVASYFFIPFDSGEKTFHPVYGVGWTINYDMYYFLIFSVFMLFPRKLGIILVIMWSIMTVGAGYFIPQEWGAIWVWTQPVVLELLLGVFIGIAFTYGHLRLPRWACYILFAIAVAWWVAGIPTVAVGIVSAPPSVSEQSALWERALPAALLLIAATLGPAEGRISLRTSRFGRIILSVGAVSFTLSLSHGFVFRAVTLAMSNRVDGKYYELIFMAISTALLIPFVSVCYWLIEKRITEFARDSAGASS